MRRIVERCHFVVLAHDGGEPYSAEEGPSANRRCGEWKQAADDRRSIIVALYRRYSSGDTQVLPRRPFVQVLPYPSIPRLICSSTSHPARCCE